MLASKLENPESESVAFFRTQSLDPPARRKRSSSNFDGILTPIESSLTRLFHRNPIQRSIAPILRGARALSNPVCGHTHNLAPINPSNQTGNGVWREAAAAAVAGDKLVHFWLFLSKYLPARVMRAQDSRVKLKRKSSMSERRSSAATARALALPRQPGVSECVCLVGYLNYSPLAGIARHTGCWCRRHD